MRKNLKRGGTPALLLMMGLLPFGVSAQEKPAAATLSLEEAIRIAKENNPDFRIQTNDAGVADWQLAESMASLLPKVNVNTGFSYQPSGRPEGFGAVTAEDLGITRTPPYYYSNYGLSLSLGISGATFFDMARQKANRVSTGARITAAEFQLSADVSREYLTALRSKDGVALALADLESARESHKLAQARFDVGEGTKIDVAQAEVQLGRAEVALIQAENLYETDKLRLLQRIGVNLDRDIELTSKLDVFEPQWTKEQLLTWAAENHPQIRSARAAEAAANAASRAAKTQYLPSLSLVGSWGGYARQIGISDSELIENAKGSIANQRASCERSNKFSALIGEELSDCARFVYSDEIGARAIAQNEVFPFNFTRSTPSFSARISIPIFDGFSRERSMQQARADAQDAKYRRHAAELAQQTAVSTAFLNLKAAQRSVQIEERNSEMAETQLQLARERYRLGAGTFVDLSVAEATRARADRDYLAALYLFHESLAALESAVGRPLRPAQQSNQ